MQSGNYIGIGGLLVALVGLITGFILQRDHRKIRELERANKKHKKRLIKALKAIKGYQAVEEEYAEMEGLSVPAYRAQVRKDKPALFNPTFLAPGNIDELMSELEEE